MDRSGNQVPLVSMTREDWPVQYMFKSSQRLFDTTGSTVDLGGVRACTRDLRFRGSGYHAWWSLVLVDDLARLGNTPIHGSVSTYRSCTIN